MRLVSPGILRNPNFRMLFCAGGISAFGAGIGALAFPLVAVVSLDASEFEVGLLTAMNSVAFLVIGLPAGVWVDRMRKHPVLIVSNLIRAVALICVPIIWWIGVLNIWELYAVGLIIGMCGVFYQVAMQSYLPALVGRDYLIEANSKIHGVQHVASVASPALAGQLVALVTAPFALMATSISIVVSTLLISRIRKGEPELRTSDRANLRRELTEGIGFILRHRMVRAIAAAATWMGFWSAMGTALFVVFLARTLNLSVGSIGILYSLLPIGSILGALVAQRAADRIGHGRILWMILVVFGPIKFLPPLSAPDWRLGLLVFSMAASACLFVVFTVVQFTAIQTVTPDSMLGRVTATSRFLSYGVAPIGSVLGGGLGAVVGVRETLYLVAIGTCFSFVPIFYSPLRRMKRLPKVDEDFSESPVHAGG